MKGFWGKIRNEKSFKRVSSLFVNAVLFVVLLGLFNNCGKGFKVNSEMFPLSSTGLNLSPSPQPSSTATPISATPTPTANPSASATPTQPPPTATPTPTPTAGSTVPPDMASRTVIPGQSGFGINTVAGRGGTVYRVTNLNDSGTGSLRACVSASGPRVCVFEVSGTIALRSDLEIRNPFITIAGQTAPAPGILLKGWTFYIMTHDVLVQHIGMRVGDDPSGPDYVNRDAMQIGSFTPGVTAENIVIDHCSFGWSMDEMVQVWDNWDNVTFSNNIFADALSDSFHPSIESDPNSPKEKHGFGPLAGGANPGKISFIGNLFANQTQRNILSAAQDLVFVNNLIYNATDIGTQIETTFSSRNSLIGNVYVRGPDVGDNRAIVLSQLTAGTQVYLQDNWALNLTSDPWSIVSFFNTSRGSVEVSSRPTWPSGLSFVSDRTLVEQNVLNRAGPFARSRMILDSRTIQGVRDRTGQVINCVAADGSTRCQKNAGGWPTLPSISRTLTLPASPNTVQADGYTNLEKWLHQMAAGIQ